MEFHGRRLFELLEEQQEPFLLEVYLLENGYSRNLLKSGKATVKCWLTETCRKFLKFSSRGIITKRGGKNFSFVTLKLVQWKMFSKALNSESRVRSSRSRSVLSCFSAVGNEARASRFSRLLHSCDQILDGKMHWKSMKDCKQLSPVSVFELQSDEACSANNYSMEEENPSTSSLNSDMFEEQQHFTWFNKLQQNEMDRKELLPSKQPILQCSKELKEGLWSSHDSFSNGKAGKLKEMQIFSLEKHTKEVARIEKLIDLDISGTSREWRYFKDEARKIGLEIERLIFEEMREETVAELFGSHW